MVQSTARTMPARSGKSRVSDERRVYHTARKTRSARKRWLIVFLLALVVIAGIMANVKPLSHFRDASGRLDKAMAKVSDLQAQQTQLQGQLAKLSETGYLEALAREKLTYAKPGEDVYIVTPDPNDTSAEATGADAGEASQAADAEGTASPSDTQSAEHPGILERALSAIRGVF